MYRPILAHIVLIQKGRTKGGKEEGSEERRKEGWEGQTENAMNIQCVVVN